MEVRCVFYLLVLPTGPMIDENVSVGSKHSMHIQYQVYLKFGNNMWGGGSSAIG